MLPRPILLKGVPLAGGRLPAVCAPLVARTRADLKAEAQAVASLRPDLLEWRIDFFEALADLSEVLAAARELRSAAGAIPVLLTRRSSREGGQPIPVDEDRVLEIYSALCEAQLVDAIDYEMENTPADVARVRGIAGAHGISLVLSFHDFGATPSPPQLAACFAKAERLGADVAKLAVMPAGPADVLALLQATLEASNTLAIPVVAMAMGRIGAVSRVCGGVFGSALTFAVGSGASAPGQMPIADVRVALDVIERHSGAGQAQAVTAASRAIAGDPAAS